MATGVDTIGPLPATTRVPPRQARGPACLRTPAEQVDFKQLRLVAGSLPEDLDGRLYRVGPGRFEDAAGAPLAHWFDGEGLALLVDIAHGEARAKWRFVADERRADYAQLGRLGAAPPFLKRVQSIWSPHQYANLANTSLMFWGERLFALYEACAPVELDPETLEILGVTTLGIVRRAFSAHPKRHAPSGDVINQGFRVAPAAALDYYRLRTDGKAEVIGSAPYNGAMMTHDFAITDKHIISISPPVFVDPMRNLFEGASLAETFNWRGDKETEFIISQIDGSAPARIVTCPAVFYSHTANAYDDGDDIVIEGVACADGSGVDWVAAVKPDAQSLPLASPIRLTRFRISFSDATVTHEPVCLAPVDFPTINDKAAGRDLRFAYLVGYTDEQCAYEDFFDAVVKVDLKNGDITKLSAGADTFVVEPVFAPRVSQDPQQKEDDGYILTIVYDADAEDSRLAVFDAAHPDKPPLALASFDAVLPMSFHGLWRARS